MAKNLLLVRQNLKPLKNYLTYLFLVIILLSINVLANASSNNKAPRFVDIQNQIIDLAPIETDIPKSLKEQLSKQCKIVMIRGKKGSANYSTGQANLEIIQPDKKQMSYVNYSPSNMHFSAHEIDLNDDHKFELEVTYVGFEAAAVNWPLWIFSREEGNYIPILKATVGLPGYAALQTTSHGYNDIVTTKTILDNPNQAAKNEYTIYKFDGSRYVINSKLIELPSADRNR